VPLASPGLVVPWPPSAAAPVRLTPMVVSIWHCQLGIWWQRYSFALLLQQYSYISMAICATVFFAAIHGIPPPFSQSSSCLPDRQFSDNRTNGCSSSATLGLQAILEHGFHPLRVPEPGVRCLNWCWLSTGGGPSAVRWAMAWRYLKSSMCGTIAADRRQEEEIKTDAMVATMLVGMKRRWDLSVVTLSRIGKGMRYMNKSCVIISMTRHCTRMKYFVEGMCDKF
jgi:hypothetical protein